jgi:hypothetical protein
LPAARGKKTLQAARYGIGRIKAGARARNKKQEVRKQEEEREEEEAMGKQAAREKRAESKLQGLATKVSAEESKRGGKIWKKKSRGKRKKLESKREEASCKKQAARARKIWKQGRARYSSKQEMEEN